MSRTFPRCSRPRLWLIVYSICCLLVLSFILFEVLDVDGSDFPQPTNTVALKLAESPADSVRRAAPALGPHGITALAVSLAMVPGTAPSQDPVIARVDPVPAPSPLVRALLPRASLDDAPHA